MNKPSLYQVITTAGIEHSNHESDLYIPANDETRAILKRFPLNQANATYFTNQADPHKGELWIDVPFAFEPFWDKVRERSAKR